MTNTTSAAKPARKPTGHRSAFVRVVRPGTVTLHTRTGQRPVDVFVKITWDGKRLSVTGVEGPHAGGNCFGSCGQIDLSCVTPAAGWEDKIGTLADYWRAWHLNDLRAGCEHQRAAKWEERPINPSKPLNAYGRHFPGQQSDSCNMLVSVFAAEHPEGLLCKPCPVCGYKYGSAWLCEKVPAKVVAWLRALPETDVTPAWV
jgi:hypothetical protein